MRVSLSCVRCVLQLYHSFILSFFPSYVIEKTIITLRKRRFYSEEDVGKVTLPGDTTLFLHTAERLTSLEAYCTSSRYTGMWASMHSRSSTVQLLG